MERQYSINVRLLGEVEALFADTESIVIGAFPVSGRGQGWACAGLSHVLC